LPTPPDPVQGIWGVASKSSDEPFKQGDFPEVIKDFKGKTKYSDWEFVYKKTPTGGAIPGSQIQLSFPLSTPESPDWNWVNRLLAEHLPLMLKACIEDHSRLHRSSCIWDKCFAIRNLKRERPSWLLRQRKFRAASPGD
jgi:hypothetical protein